MFFACGIWCVADISRDSPSSEQKIVHTHISGENNTHIYILTLETSATDYIPQAKNILYQLLLINPYSIPVYTVLLRINATAFIKFFTTGGSRLFKTTVLNLKYLLCFT